MIGQVILLFSRGAGQLGQVFLYLLVKILYTQPLYCILLDQVDQTLPFIDSRPFYITIAPYVNPI